MATNTGIDEVLTDMFDAWFGKWRNLVISIISSLVAVTGMLVLCGYCCVPCIRPLCVRLIITTIEGKQPQPQPHLLSSGG